MERCDHCRFWRAVAEGAGASVGECRRHAPTPGAVLWPKVGPERWCGEFQLQTGPKRPGAALRAVGDGVVRLA